MGIVASACALCSGAPKMATTASGSFFVVCQGCGKQTVGFNLAEKAMLAWEEWNVPVADRVKASIASTLVGGPLVKKCARCGTTPDAIEKIGGFYRMECPTCGLEAGNFRTLQAAVADWNMDVMKWNGDLEVLSCPFCNRFAKLTWDTDRTTGYVTKYWIECSNCKCRGPMMSDGKGAIVGWNGRFSQAPKPVVIKEPVPEPAPKFSIALSQPVISLMPRTTIKREPIVDATETVVEEIQEEESMVQRTRFKMDQLFGDIQNRLNWFTAGQLADSFGVKPGAVTAVIRDMKADSYWKVQTRRDGNEVMYNITKGNKHGSANQRGGQATGKDEAGDGLAEPSEGANLTKGSGRSAKTGGVKHRPKATPDGKEIERGSRGNGGSRASK